MKPFCTWISGWLLALTLALGPALANPIDDKVKHSLVQLVAVGTARIGPALGTDLSSRSTGFFVGTGGYILTTAHLFNPLKAVNAANTKISAQFEGTGTGSVDVLYVSELASLDLVLLRAIVVNNIAIPPSLEIGDTTEVDLQNPELRTSGYDLTGFRSRALEFNSTSNALSNVAWTLNNRTNAGASGSPVYIDKAGVPLVVGILKATAKDDDEFSFMIPIENSFPLIGHFKLQALIKEMAALQATVGAMSANKPPLSNRVDGLEKSVDQIKGSFAWGAETDDRNGSLIIKYNKIVSDGPQITEISVKIQPSAYVADESNAKQRRVIPLLTWTAITKQRTALEPDERTGIFILPGIREKLTEVIMDSDETFKDQDPFREIVLKISANTGETVFQTKLSIVPKFTWVYNTQ
jgi:hypothetical protein